MPLKTLADTIRKPSTWRRTPVRGTSAMPGRPKKDRTRTRRILIRLAIVAGVVFVVGVIGAVGAFAWLAKDLPDPSKLSDRVVAESTRIYDKTGTHLLYEIHGDERRTIVELDAISDHLKNATIMAEDKDFYSHSGFDLSGILRAVFKNISDLDPVGQGGSTITQQFVKNSILTTEKSYTRKIKEVVLSYQIEKRFSKDEILKLYLNEIPYGSNLYGIEAAAQTFFGVSAKDLTLAQSALIASVPKAPTYYSPYGNHRDALIARQHSILDTMANEGVVSREEADAAKAEELEFRSRKEGIIAPHFVFYVRELLVEEYGESIVDQGGLKVITTLDIDHQVAAEEAVAEYGPRNQERWAAGNASLVSIDTKTGQILAMVGSRDYFDVEHDGNVNVALSPRQPGSSFKPFVYETAFEKGYTPETMVFDLVTNFETGSGRYTPHNYDGREHGPISFRRALAGSLNIPAVKALYLAGLDPVLDNAKKLGYTTLDDHSRFGLSLVLGGAEVKLLEHVSAYATLAREGLRHPTTPILRVEDHKGKVLEEFKAKETRVLNEEAVRSINDVLSDNSARSYIFGAQNNLILPDRPVAAKTGTTNDYHDAWTLGYTPSIAAGVWVGNNDNSEMKRGADGSVIAAPIWQTYMKKVLAGTPVETFKKPKPNTSDKPILRGEIDLVHKIPVDKITGKVIPESCRDTYPQSFVVVKDFKETHNILHWVDKNNPKGPAPSKPTADAQYEAWEGPVRAWARGQNYPDIDKLPEERCDLRDNDSAPTIEITSPDEDDVITTQTHQISVEASATVEITSVALFIDGVQIHSFEGEPYRINYTNTGFPNGEHTLRAVVTDEVGRVAEASVDFEYNITANSVLDITSPQANATFSESDFPIDLTMQTYAPEGIASIIVTANNSTLQTVSDPGMGRITVSIPSLPKGSITLAVNATTRSGAILTDSIRITVQ